MKTTKVAVKFEDFDIATKTTVFKTFPAGTKVKDVLKVSNPRAVRLYAVVGVDGWLAYIPESSLAS